MKLDWRAFVVLPVCAGHPRREVGARGARTQRQCQRRQAKCLVAFGGALADGSLLLATRDTLASAFGGLAIGGAIGLALGILLGSVGALNRLMEVTLELIRPIPSVALAPPSRWWPWALAIGWRSPSSPMPRHGRSCC